MELTEPATRFVEWRVSVEMGDLDRTDPVNLAVAVGLRMLGADDIRPASPALLLLLALALTLRVNTDAACLGGGGPISARGFGVTFGGGTAETAGLDDKTPLLHTFCTMDFADERKPNRFFSKHCRSVKFRVMWEHTDGWESVVPFHRQC